MIWDLRLYGVCSCMLIPSSSSCDLWEGVAARFDVGEVELQLSAEWIFSMWSSLVGTLRLRVPCSAHPVSAVQYISVVLHCSHSMTALEMEGCQGSKGGALFDANRRPVDAVVAKPPIEIDSKIAGSTAAALELAV
jgi:hypothetical protein